ncbi:MAG: DUF86 domain-containing protein [Candidatus Binatia bacterium]
MVDRERVLARIDELDGYLKELHQTVPASFQEYQNIEKRRACERLLQISVECVIDICHLFVSGLRLGLPAEEDDLFEKLEQGGVLSSQMKATLKEMKGCRNILMHEYSRVDDRIVYETVKSKLGDFGTFKKEVLRVL